MSSSQMTDQQIRAALKRWQDPIAFVRDVWGWTPWALPKGVRPHGSHGQIDLFHAIKAGAKRISWAAAQKTGKTMAIMALAFWWVFTRPRGKVTLIAPTGNQISEPMWAQLTELHQSARVRIPGRLYSGWEVKGGSGGFVTPWGNRIFGRAPENVHAMQGISGKEQLVIGDEASGIDERVLEAALGNLRGGGTLILAGNPVSVAGTFYASHTTEKGVWHTLQSSGLDSPNFYGGNVPGLATPDGLEFDRQHWGEGSAAWVARVEGRFPDTATDTVISLQLTHAALLRLRETEPVGPLSVGIDPAGFGDDNSVIYFRRGLRPIALLAFHGLDGPDLAGKFLEALGPLRGHGEPVRVNVDVTGEGASCFDALVRAAQPNGLELNGVNFGASPTTQPPIGPGYANLATQMWFELRAALEQGAALPDESVCSRVDSAKLEGELVARKYGFDLQGRLCIERKKDMKARIGRSPDRADACVLAHYQPPPAGHVAVRGQKRSRYAGGFGGF
jgi:phage terminase large subunit